NIRKVIGPANETRFKTDRREPCCEQISLRQAVARPETLKRLAVVLRRLRKACRVPRGTPLQRRPPRHPEPLRHAASSTALDAANDVVEPAVGDAARCRWRRAFGDTSSVLATSEQNAASGRRQRRLRAARARGRCLPSTGPSVAV